MKKLVILLSLMGFACSSDDNDKENQNNVPQEDTLIGTWELIENYGSDGYGQDGGWSQAAVIYSYTFREDNIVLRSSFNCTGIYESTNEYVEVDFNCPNNPFTKSYDLTFDDHHLILTENPNPCDEVPCALKFKKINSN